MQEEPPIAYDIVFKGIVQGVGFRYTSYEIARSHPGVCGWVRNHWNGSVEMHVQGRRTDVDAYLHNIISESRLSRLIETVSKKTGTVISNMRGFIIDR